jgi:thiamine phosphate synthase YjbQ (UPF0047 family)
MIRQIEFLLPEYRYGFHLVTSQIVSQIGELPKTGLLNLGTWQGIYLCKFRYSGGRRKIVATIYS